MEKAVHTNTLVRLDDRIKLIDTAMRRLYLAEAIHTAYKRYWIVVQYNNSVDMHIQRAVPMVSLCIYLFTRLLM